MLVRYRMSQKVIVADPLQPLAEARELLAKRRIRQMPVLSEARVVGIVTDRDLRSAPPSARVVRDIMTPKPVTIGPDAPVDEAARLLRLRKINALPVVEKGKLVGILTATDVLELFIDLSGVAEPTYRLTVSGKDQKAVPAAIRQVIERVHGEVKWIGRDHRQSNTVHLRLKTRKIGDVETALEAAGYEVLSIVAPGASQM